MAKESDKKEYKLLFIGLGVLLLVIVLWCLTIYFLKNDENRGTFGDMFGAVNALFSGLAFTGIIFTILLQREELSLQRLELQETRNELKRSADAQERSEKALINQQNQTTFFNLLEQQKKLIETIRIGENVGFAAIREFSNEIRRKLPVYLSMEQKKYFPLFSDTAKHPTALIQNHKPQIITYFKNLETIIKFIESNLSNDVLFHSILYSYISVPEKYLLGICYYYCGDKLETKYLKEHFNYIEHFETLLYNHKYDSEQYFPYLFCKGTYYKNFYEEMFDKKSVLKFTIQINHNLLGFKVELLELEVDVSSDQMPPDFGIIENIKDYIVNEQNDLEINVNIDEFYKRTLPTLPNGEFNFFFTFTFRYAERIYKVSYKHILDKIEDYSFDEEDYTDTTRYILTFPETT